MSQSSPSLPRDATPVHSALKLCLQACPAPAQLSSLSVPSATRLGSARPVDRGLVVVVPLVAGYPGRAGRLVEDWDFDSKAIEAFQIGCQVRSRKLPRRRPGSRLWRHLIGLYGEVSNTDLRSVPRYVLRLRDFYARMKVYLNTSACELLHLGHQFPRATAIRRREVVLASRADLLL